MDNKDEITLGQSFKKSIGFGWKAEKKLLIVLVLLGIAITVISYLQTVSFSKIVDEIIRIKNHNLGITNDLVRQSILLGLSFLLPSAFGNLFGLFQAKFRTKFSTYLELWLVDSFANIDIATAESTEFQTRLQSAEQWGIGSINNCINLSIGVLQDIVGVITATVILWVIEPKLVFLAVISSVPAYFVRNKYGMELFKFHSTRSDEKRILGNRRSHFRNPSSLVEVLLFNLKKKFRTQIKEINEDIDKKAIKLTAKNNTAQFLLQLFYTATFGLAIVMITKETLAGILPIGSLLLAFATYRSFFVTVSGFFADIAVVQEQARYSKRWFDLFAIKPHIIENPNAIKFEWNTAPSIEFKNVSFSYPDQEKKILKDISISIKPGEKVAIVGENGAGKTTLIRLLARIYDPTEGEILVNGTNLRDVDIDSWRKAITVLFQDFSNYNMPVKEAIAISLPEEPVNQEKVQKSAMLSGSDIFITDLPKQYDQLLWKGFQDGVALSKGQYQRLAVARVLYRDTPVMILDEPTAAIDAITEEKIFDTLERKLTDKTVILISHRFSTVKNADKIVVIEDGKIKESGGHKELMVKNGRYAELYTMQANRYLEENELSQENGEQDSE